MRRSIFSLLALAALAPTALSYTVHDVTVGGLEADGVTPMLAFSPPYLNATPGDVVRFTFHVKNHTVTQSSFEAPCSKLTDDNGTLIGFDSGFMPISPTATTATTFNITVNSTTPIWGYCRQSGATPTSPTHCQSGMVFAINPAPSGEKTFFNYQTLAKFSTTQQAQAMGETVKVHDVVVGGTQADGVTPNLVYIPNNLTAKVGEKVRFHFQGKNHTVTQSSFEAPCSKLVDGYGNPDGFDSGFTPVNVTTNATSGPTFEITVNQTTPIWGYCRQVGATPSSPTHCQSGMNFAINSPESGVKTFANFQTLARFSTTQQAQMMGEDPAKVHDVVVGGLKSDGVTPNLVYVPNNVTAKQGEKVVFHFSVKNHTVTQSSFDSPCSKLVNSYNQPIGFDSGFMPVSNASLLESESPSFSITVNDSSTPIWAYCRQLGATPDAPTHCQSGMVLGINAPTSGNTLEKFITNAMDSTSQTGHSAVFSSSFSTSTSASYSSSSSTHYSSSSSAPAQTVYVTPTTTTASHMYSTNAAPTSTSASMKELILSASTPKASTSSVPKPTTSTTPHSTTVPVVVKASTTARTTPTPPPPPPPKTTIAAPKRPATTAKAPTKGLSNALASDSDSDVTSDSSSTFHQLLNFMPAILGLLSGAVLLLLVLLVLAIVMIRHHGWKGVSGPPMRSLSATYRPVQLSGPGGASGSGRGFKEMEEEGRYHDSEGSYSEGPVH